MPLARGTHATHRIHPIDKKKKCGPHSSFSVEAESYEPHYSGRIGEMVFREQFFGDQELVKTELYNDFMKPEGWFYCCGILMFEDEQTAVSISARRSQQAGPYTSEEIALFQYLDPHFRCAARIQQRINRLEKIISGELNVKALAKFDVTPAQAKLAVALFNGMRVEEYAQEAGISINTASMHIQHLYGKTGVKRQTELIRLLAKTAAHI